MPEKLTELLANDENLVWIDMEKPNDDENRVLSKVFNFHPLTIEDAIDWKLLEEKIL
jgi:Mg2+ and Co2+ transporter CorA